MIFEIQYDAMLLPLALILLLGKFLQIVCKKVGLPQVLGLLVAGLIIGLIQYIPGQNILNANSLEGISFISKIGVILIMFSAGLDTDIKKVKETGVKAIVITLMGVIFPLGFGFLVATLFNGGFGALSNHEVLYQNLFYGTIITATSVSVTIATLKEMGKLDSKVGTTLVSAAILDDIIGVILLSFMIGLSGATTGDGSVSYGASFLAKLFNTDSSSPYITVILIVLFFVFVIVSGLLFRKGFKLLSKKYHNHRRLPIFGIAAAFFYAWISEMVFGVADITGAFFCGLTIASNESKPYVEEKSDILSYMLFTPVFFANVGLSIKLDSLNPSFVGFGICFIIAGILGKVLGCGLGAKATGFNMKDSVRVGVGMMAQAEVTLICLQKGVDAVLPSGATLVSSDLAAFVVILICLTSCLAPVFLKMTYKKELNTNIESLNN